MFTIFDALRLSIVLGGTFGAMLLGAKHWGIVGGVAGLTLGGALARLVAELPWRLARWQCLCMLSMKSTDDLRTALREAARPGLPVGIRLMPNMLLLALHRRGEDIQRDLPVVFEMLSGETFAQRTRGWAALTSAFPDVVRHFADYRLDDSVDVCRAKVARAKEWFEAARPR